MWAPGGADRADPRRRRDERLPARRHVRRRVRWSASASRRASPEVLAGIALLLLIGYAFSWVFAFIGLTASSPEAANAYGFTILFPLTFVSSAFVPVDSMPSWLQPIAEHNPFTTMVDAARALFVGTPAGNDVWLAVVWSLAIIAVFAPLSVWRYRSARSRARRR